MDISKINRICIVNKDEGFISVNFSVSNELMAGAEFKLLNSNNLEEINTWKMASKNASKSIYTIKLTAENINRHILTWQALVCSLNPKVFIGEINVVITQKGHPCRINIPATKEFDNIAPCQLNRPDKATQSLMFVLKT